MRIALDPWGSDYASQVSVPHEADGAETTVQALVSRSKPAAGKPSGLSRPAGRP